MTQFYCLILLPESEQQPPAPLLDANEPWKARAETASRYLKLRANRDNIADAQLLSDPAWDMLLDLYAARLEGRRVSVSSLCIAAAVPPTSISRRRVMP